MSNMQKAAVNPVAILCSDLHLTLKQPVCRNDDDWMETQAFALAQISVLQGILADQIGDFPPILCAGDIFDKWNPPPELISFAFRNLPKRMLCVPGQHDLPNHRMDEMFKSAYGVLVEAERIHDLSLHQHNKQVSFHGFGWNQKIAPPDKSFKNSLKVAVIHKYVWKTGFSYAGAPESARIQSLNAPLSSYNVAVFGDNHKGFSVRLKNGTEVFNCGGFIRRKSDEIHYKPQVGILYEDGSVKPHFLKTDLDKFHPNTKRQEEEAFDMKDFLEQLEGLGEQALDFREAVKAYFRENNVPKAVKALTLAALE